ncbi:MAG: HEAT repeat domain-containing protein [Planctomycetota bacterium]
MLPKAELKAVYGDVVWVWVYRDFKNDERDRAAERVEIRFSVTTYPNLFLVDPSSQEVLSETGRELGGFLSAVKAAASRVKKGKAAAGDDPDATACELEDATAAKKSHAKAATLVGDADPVVRFRALQNLVGTDAGVVVKRAKGLLEVKSDPFRFAVLDALKAAGDAGASQAVLALLKDADSPQVASRNPNVLRMHAADALGAMGDASAIEALRPFATSGDFLNGVTRTSVQAVASIGSRCGDKAKRSSAEALLGAFPKADAVPANQVAHRKTLVELVHKELEGLLGSGPDLPADWTEASRAALLKAWQARLGKGR